MGKRCTSPVGGWPSAANGFLRGLACPWHAAAGRAARATGAARAACGRVNWRALGLCLAAALPPAQAADGPVVEVRWQVDDRVLQAQGPLADALAASPGLLRLESRVLAAQLSVRHTMALPTPAEGLRWRLGLHGLARHEKPEGATGRDASRVAEAYLAADAGPFGLSAGKQVLGWDVGYAFRPNDVVQQEDRRSLAGLPLEGRPLVQAEWFGGADSALSLVWVNPQAGGRTAAQAPGGEEPALALRAYHRIGGLDLHGFARQGQRTGSSAGLAAAWVPGEATEWHASVRVMQRHEAWQMAPISDGTLAAADPWARMLRGRASQALVGFNWTGSGHLGVLAEAWYDGTAPSRGEWQAWLRRNAALRALAADPRLAPGAAANLAWQTRALQASSLNRQNLLLRMSWQPPAWQLWADVLWQPADRGRSLSAGLQWQGEHWGLQASVRANAGPADAALAQSAWRRQAAVAVTFVP